ATRGDAVVELDLTDPAEVAQAIEWIRQQYGEIGALIHLLPLNAAVSEAVHELDRAKEGVRIGVKSLYLPSRELAPALEGRGAEAGALVCTVTGRGGRFGIQPDSSVPAIQFAAADFTKTLALELTRVTCRVIDLDPADPLAVQEVKLADEIASGETAVQTG